jgi:membrane associated rhomboid family serine protease
MGHRRFLGFYVLCGVIAALAQIMVDATSQVPVIGASGAVSGVLGAYLVLHPRVKVWVLAFGLIPVRLPTFIVLGLWIGMQVVMSLMTVEGEPESIAWWAHIGGFVAGAVLIRYFRYPHVPLWDTSTDGEIKVSGLRFRRKKNGSNDA